MSRTRPSGPALAAAALTALLLVPVQAFVRVGDGRPLLLAERFWPGAGWAEIALLALYAGWLASVLRDPQRAPRRRRVLWALFSAVFFTQLVLGLFGVEQLLMTGQLHLPVPALIVGGPLYRGGGLFMPVLLGVTVLLVGPAWCSHLCYIGAWDSALADRRRRPDVPAQASRWPRGWPRLVTLAVVVAGALGLRALGVPGGTAALLGGGFGLVGVAVMFGWSRRRGVMVHCVDYCPIGLLTAVFGKLSPFRLAISDCCTDCGACTPACRYDALRRGDVARRRPALSCTLCGDCVRTCRGGAIGYRFLWLSPIAARTLFVVLVSALHAVFLGVARI